MPSYKHFIESYIPKHYGYSFHLNTKHSYGDLWLANLHLNKTQSLYLPFKYFNIKLTITMSNFTDYKQWKV